MQRSLYPAMPGGKAPSGRGEKAWRTGHGLGEAVRGGTLAATVDADRPVLKQEPESTRLGTTRAWKRVTDSLGLVLEAIRSAAELVVARPVRRLLLGTALLAAGCTGWNHDYCDPATCLEGGAQDAQESDAGPPTDDGDVIVIDSDALFGNSDGSDDGPATEGGNPQPDMVDKPDLRPQPDMVKPIWDPKWPYCHDVGIAKRNANAALPAKAMVDVQFYAATWDQNELAALRIADPGLKSIRFLAGTCAKPDVMKGYLRQAIQTAALVGRNVVWVELPNNQDTGNLAMLVGNPNAVEVSDPGILALLDRFEGNALGNIWNCTGTCTVNNGLTLVGPRAFVTSSMAWGIGYQMVALKQVMGQNAQEQYNAWGGFYGNQYAVWVKGGMTKFGAALVNPPEMQTLQSQADNGLHVWTVKRLPNGDALLEYDGDRWVLRGPPGQVPVEERANAAGVSELVNSVAVAPAYDADPVATVSP